MKYLFIFLIFSIISYSKGFIDTVYSFTLGTLQSTGQSEEYFPMNIFGPPSFDAARFTPEIRPEQILSLGLNGEIIIGFKNGVIANGEGADFIIFENAFEISFNEKIYAEPAIVSVSQDGSIWYEFEYDLDMLTGLAGTEPTIGNNTNSEYGFSGGNAFDIGEFGLEEIKYIKLKDTTEYILNNPNHNNYDPTLSGFDLDAVFLLYAYSTETPISVEISSKKEEVVVIYDINGNEVEKIIKPGRYFMIFENGVKKILKY